MLITSICGGDDDRPSGVLCVSVFLDSKTIGVVLIASSPWLLLLLGLKLIQYMDLGCLLYYFMCISHLCSAPSTNCIQFLCLYVTLQTFLLYYTNFMIVFSSSHSCSTEPPPPANISIDIDIILRVSIIGNWYGDSYLKRKCFWFLFHQV